MNRVVDPLRAMGADITFKENEGRLPLVVRGAKLVGMSHRLKVASAQVKSALLLAGLFAEGRTSVAGAGGSRDHTELLLATMGVACEEEARDETPGVVGPARPGSFDIRVPGDPSSAAFFHVAAALVPGSEILTPGLSLNYTRTGALRVLRRCGVKVAIERPSGPPGGESLGDVRVSCNELKPFKIDGPDIPALVDEIPILAVLATQAAGETVITGAEELRVKESDRLAVTAENLGRLGARVVESKGGLKITGPTPLVGGSRARPLTLDTAGDHRIAMAMAVAALVTKGETALDEDGCVEVSYPYFFRTLELLL
jgi:3-phosphoshikimate 1-carboxyvinyltransferase